MLFFSGKNGANRLARDGLDGAWKRFGQHDAIINGRNNLPEVYSFGTCCVMIASLIDPIILGIVEGLTEFLSTEPRI